MDSTFGLTLAAGSGVSPALISVGLIAFIGVGSQWLAWRLKIPSILLLLVGGILVGPVARRLFPGSPWALDPSSLVDSDLLFSLVGISVGLILYEGGLTLRFREVRTVKRIVISLVTLGAFVTWVIASVAAWVIFALDLPLAILLGAILVVTGPTVIGPMLGHIRPSGATGPVLKWEGIVIDPIGVLLAVLVFEVILIGQTDTGDAASTIWWAIVKTVVAGGGLGVIGAMLMLVLMSRYWVSDTLQNPVSLMLAVVVFVLSDTVQAESGLLATTVMGMVLANQKRADIRHILEFKESLRVLLIGALFVVLAARVRMEDLMSLELGAIIGFLAVLVVVARPAAVWISTLGTGLTINERLFLSALAPRGIVAAAGASIFAIGLASADTPLPEAERLVPIVFAVIIGTVGLYGLAASPIARALGVSDQDPQGIVFIGAPSWVRTTAAVLRKRGIRVLLIDTNRGNIRAARMDNIDAVQANVLDEWVLDELDLRGIGRAFAATPNDEVNTLALQRFGEVIDKSALYRLPTPAKSSKKTGSVVGPGSGSVASSTGRSGPASGTSTVSGVVVGPSSSASATKAGAAATGKHRESEAPTIGRRAFDARADFATLEAHVKAGWVIKATNVSDEFTYEDFRRLYGPAAIPLLVISGSDVIIGTAGRGISPDAGDTVVALVDPDALLMPGFAPDPPADAKT